MQLRSGKVVNKYETEIMDVAKTLMSLNKSNTHPLYQMCVNQKIKEAPQILQENCGNCLRQIVEESVLKGINIKFEIQ